MKTITTDPATLHLELMNHHTRSIAYSHDRAHHASAQVLAAFEAGQNVSDRPDLQESIEIIQREMLYRQTAMACIRVLCEALHAPDATLPEGGL